MLPSRVSTHACVGNVHRALRTRSGTISSCNGHCRSRNSCTKGDLNNEIVAPSLNAPFRTKIVADTSFLGSDCSARDVCLLDDRPDQGCTDPLSSATPAPSVKRRARETGTTCSARSFDGRHDICYFSSGSQRMHSAAAS